MNEGNFLFSFRIIYSAVTITVVALVVIWALRSGQFRNNKRASRLPLEIDTGDNFSNENK